MVCNRKFGNPEPHPLGEYRNIAVHISIQFKSSGYLFPVHLQAAVKIVKSDAGKKTGHSIEQFRRNCFGDRILALLLPSADQIIPFLQLFDHLLYGKGVILQVSVDGANVVTGGGRESRRERCGFSEVSLKGDEAKLWP